MKRNIFYKDSYKDFLHDKDIQQKQYYTNINLFLISNLIGYITIFCISPLFWISDKNEKSLIIIRFVLYEGLEGVLNWVFVPFVCYRLFFFFFFFKRLFIQGKLWKLSVYFSKKVEVLWNLLCIILFFANSFIFCGF